MSARKRIGLTAWWYLLHWRMCDETSNTVHPPSQPYCKRDHAAIKKLIELGVAREVPRPHARKHRAADEPGWLYYKVNRPALRAAIERFTP